MKNRLQALGLALLALLGAPAGPAQAVDRYVVGSDRDVRPGVLTLSKITSWGATTATSVRIGATAAPTQALSVTGRVTVAPSGTTEDNTYNGSLVVTRPTASGQYINLVRSGSFIWSIGYSYNTSNFAIGIGNATDSSFTSPAFSINSSGAVSLSTPLGVASGGTGRNTLTTDRLLAGNGTSAVQQVTVGSGLSLSAGTLTATATAIPTGGIIMWSGSIGSIPSGWALCDGTSGTPDLRDRFVIGAHSTLAPGSVGGSSSHSHTQANALNHTHQVGSISDDVSGTVGTAVEVATVSPGTGTLVAPQNHNHTFVTDIFNTGNANSTWSTDSESSLPPYYALAYIIKV